MILGYPCALNVTASVLVEGGGAVCLRKRRGRVMTEEPVWTEAWMGHESSRKVASNLL